MTTLSQEEIINGFFPNNSAQQYKERDRFSGGPWVFVDKANNLLVSHDKPQRLNHNELNLKALTDVVMLPYSMCHTSLPTMR
jgi:hypothetical protein